MWRLRSLVSHLYLLPDRVAAHSFRRAEVRPDHASGSHTAFYRFLLFFFHVLVGILTFGTDILVFDSEMIGVASRLEAARSKMQG